MRPVIDINGQTFGKLKVVCRDDQRSPDGGVRWKLLCSDCGGFTYRGSTDLKRGRIGCLANCRDLIAENSPVNSVYRNYRLGADRRNLAFEIDFEFFKEAISKNCFYCNSGPVSYYKKKKGRQGLSYNGLDRVDNSQGYTHTNIVTCCKFCNFAKSRWGVKDFEAWLARIKQSEGK